MIIGPPCLSSITLRGSLQFVQSLIGCPVTDADRNYVLCPRPADSTVIDRQLGDVGQEIS
jgi:hypothetical protein